MSKYEQAENKMKSINTKRKRVWGKRSDWGKKEMKDEKKKSPTLICQLIIPAKSPGLNLSISNLLHFPPQQQHCGIILL